MGWTKYGLFGAILVVIFTVSIFGAYAGYSVEGVPQSGDEYLKAEYSEWREAGYGHDVVFEYWKQFIRETTALDSVWKAMGFFFAMISFRMDGMPEFISAFFIVISLLSLYLFVSLIRGN